MNRALLAAIPVLLLPFVARRKGSRLRRQPGTSGKVVFNSFGSGFISEDNNYVLEPTDDKQAYWVFHFPPKSSQAKGPKLLSQSPLPLSAAQDAAQQHADTIKGSALRRAPTLDRSTWTVTSVPATCKKGRSSLLAGAVVTLYRPDSSVFATFVRLGSMGSLADIAVEVLEMVGLGDRSEELRGRFKPRKNVGGESVLAATFLFSGDTRLIEDAYIRKMDSKFIGQFGAAYTEQELEDICKWWSP